MERNLINKKVILSEICEINPSSSEIRDLNNDIEVSFIPMANVSEDGKIDLSEKRLLKEVKKGFTYFKNGDVLFAKITPCMENGKGAIAESLENGIGFGSTEFHVLRPNKLINSRWVYYLTISKQFRKIAEHNMTGSAGQKRVPKQFLDNYELILLPTNYQEKTVKALDKALELIDKRKAQIEALDELVKSKFIEMFGDPILNSKGWEVKLLGTVCDMKAGKNIKAADIFDENTGNLYPCYGGNGLRGYVVQYSHEGNIPLIGRQGALCGNVKYAQGKFYATEHAVVTQPRIEMNSYWLYYTLVQLNLNRLSTGAAQPGLTVGNLNELEIPIAPINMQNEFENFANQIDKLKFEMEESLRELENNFKSLMQKAFNGELFK